MKKRIITTGVLTAALVATMTPAAFAMPGDIQEAVTQPEYNAYAHQSGTAVYDESQLLAVDGNYMACFAPVLNIRESADINAKVIGTLAKGQKVKISADENDWLRFDMGDGRIGYVYDEYMEAVGQ